jgi:exodeoxyribonuclease V alpha subunit
VVGDADQLPSVGPGLFLANLLSLDEVPCVRLTKLFRRAEESPITYIAHQVNKAVLPDIPIPDGVTKGDAYFLPAPEPPRAAETIEKLVVDQIPRKFGVPSSQIMVLTPMNQGELGTVGLNRRLQERLVPQSSGFPKVMLPHIEFRLGDRVCQRVNNYSLDPQGVFNGDQGTVVAVDSEKKALVVRLWDGREIEYKEDVLGQLDLAYAITIHRSQGSEAAAVVLALHEQHGLLLDRQLLYTAVTRAKKLLIIVGSKRAMMRATQRNRSRTRYTYLAERVRQAVDRNRGRQRNV